jgi:argininosuccinate lyase
MKNKNKTVWSKRLKGKISKSFQRIGSSINVDKRLYKQDILGSIVHTQMLIKQKIIPFPVGKKIIKGLNKIKSQIDKGKFIFHEKFEDIHLNIEKKLFDIIGSDAGFMHTARSRNDQVVTDLKLWVKESTADIIDEISNVMKSLVKIFWLITKC